MTCRAATQVQSIGEMGFVRTCSLEQQVFPTSSVSKHVAQVLVGAALLRVGFSHGFRLMALPALVFPRMFRIELVSLA